MNGRERRGDGAAAPQRRGAGWLPRRARWVAGGMLSGCLLAGGAYALEAGLPQYPLGVDTLYAGDFPPIPGVFLNVYGLSYSIGDIRDARGRAVFTGFRGAIQALAARPVVVWDAEALGGRPVTFATLPLFDRTIHASLDVAGPAGPLRAFDARQKRFGLGDVSVAQLLTWRGPGGWSWYAGLEAFLPTGDYDRRLPFNVGPANNVTIYPQAAVTLRTPENHHMSLKAMYGISTRNTATGYKNGQHLIVEGAGGVGLTRQVGLDLTGFALVQTTNDEKRGASLDRGNRTALFGIGPQIRVNVGPGALSVKYQREFGASNAPKGHRVYIQIGIPVYVP